MLISLIGEQPIPNLLPILYYQPTATLAVHSGLTLYAAERLKDLLSDDIAFFRLPVDAYDIQTIQTTLLNEIRRQRLKVSDHIFNLTGGTKPMSLAAYLVARELAAPIIYLQSEGKHSRLLRYEFQGGEAVLAKDELLPGLICISQYLQAHIGSNFEVRKNVPDDDGHRFEQAVSKALQPVLDEMACGINLKGTVDLDLIVRCENQVGILEAKLGKNHMKQAIDQLNTAGGKIFLGTYTQKFLVSDQRWDVYPDLKDLASARQITIIELPESRGLENLSAENTAQLQQAVLSGLGRQ